MTQIELSHANELHGIFRRAHASPPLTQAQLADLAAALRASGLDLDELRRLAQDAALKHRRGAPFDIVAWAKKLTVAQAPGDPLGVKRRPMNDAEVKAAYAQLDARKTRLPKGSLMQKFNAAVKGKRDPAEQLRGRSKPDVPGPVAPSVADARKAAARKRQLEEASAAERSRGARGEAPADRVSGDPAADS